MIRVIARLDIKGGNLVKGVAFEGVRPLGDAASFAEEYASDGADELLLMDAVASLYGRSNILAEVERISSNCFVPITVGGGLRTVADMRAALLAGADKLAINTAALMRPELITEAANIFGSQAITVSIEAKRVSNGWECYRDSGREPSGLNVVSWAQQAENLGAGEILLSSVDRDGTMSGFDLDLLMAVWMAIEIPVVISGGCRDSDDAVAASRASDGVAIGAALHHEQMAIAGLKQRMIEDGLSVRP